MFGDLAVEAGKVLDSGFSAAFSAGLTAVGRSAAEGLRDLVTGKIRVLSADPRQRVQQITRAAESDHDFAVSLAIQLAAIVDHQAGPPPSAPLGFVDRAGVRARMARLGVYLIIGPARSGKTSLALQSQHDLAVRDGLQTAYADCDNHRNTTGQLRYADLATEILGQLGITGLEKSDPALERQYRRAPLLRRFALVLDNVISREEVERLATHWPAATVYCTARRLAPGLTTIPGVTYFEIYSLEAQGVRALIEQQGLAPAFDADPEAAAEILEICDGLPATLLAAMDLINLSGGHRQAVADTADALRGNPDPDAVLLTDVFGKLPAELGADFALLARHPGATFTAAGATAVLGRPADRTLRELRRTCLLETEPAGNYRIPGPYRAYARTLMSAPGEDEAIGRVAAYYSLGALRADYTQEPLRLHPWPAPADMEPWRERQKPVDWLEANLPHLAAVIDVADERDDAVMAVRIAGGLEVLHTYRSHASLIESCLAKIAALLTRTPGDFAFALVRVHLARSRALRALGHVDQARVAYAEAARWESGLDEPRLRSSLIEGAAMLAPAGDERIALFTKALELDRAHGLDRGRGLHARMIANDLVAQGRFAEALVFVGEADGFTRADEPRNRSRIHAVRAKVYLGSGRFDEAGASLGAAWRDARASGATRYEEELTGLEARWMAATGDHAGARERWTDLAGRAFRDGRPAYDTYLADLKSVS